MPILLPVTLAMAAAAAILNFWLAMRVGNVRRSAQVSIGDGGNDMLARRMRAQLNFAENTPWVLMLVAALELAGRGGEWLAYVGMIYMFGRLAHGLGMDGTGLKAGRGIGTATTMLTQLGLAIFAVLVLTGRV